MITKIVIPPFFDHIGAQWMARTKPISAPVTRYCGADRKSIAFLMNWIRNMP